MVNASKKNYLIDTKPASGVVTNHGIFSAKVGELNKHGVLIIAGQGRRLRAKL